jgi:hypothetical protein
MKNITNVLAEYSAIQFANKKMGSIEVGKTDQEYEEYMRDVFGGSDSTIIQCMQNAYCQFLNEYKTMCEMYHGWIVLGKVYILSKKDKVILCLFSVDEVAAKCLVEYNPYDVDLFEISVSKNHLFQNMETEYVLSKDINKLKSELASL